MWPLYLIFGAIIAAIITMICLSHLKTFKLTSSTRGSVTSTQQREITLKDGTRGWETLITASYQAAGKTYSVSHTLPGRHTSRFPPGHPLTIRYAPAEPHVSAISL